MEIQLKLGVLPDVNFNRFARGFSDNEIVIHTKNGAFYEVNQFAHTVRTSKRVRVVDNFSSTATHVVASLPHVGNKRVHVNHNALTIAVHHSQPLSVI